MIQAMKNRLQFFKMHGLGNDFVIVNKNALPMQHDISDLAKQISCRYTGIGSDQLIVYQKHSDYCDMEIYNTDGSRSNACGNATRCLAALLGEKEFTLRVGQRNLVCHLLDNGNVSVNMGKVSFDEPWMPPSETIRSFAGKYRLNPELIIPADIGNRHLVIFGSFDEGMKNVLGEKAQEIVDGGLNVNFASPEQGAIKLVVWERGVGFTLACGSGACASFAAAHKLGLVGEQAEVKFKLGSLVVSRKPNGIDMAGTTQLVAAGEYFL